jgi:hypothetical protein
LWRVESSFRQPVCSSHEQVPPTSIASLKTLLIFSTLIWVLMVMVRQRSPTNVSSENNHSVGRRIAVGGDNLNMTERQQIKIGGNTYRLQTVKHFAALPPALPFGSARRWEGLKSRTAELALNRVQR